MDIKAYKLRRADGLFAKAGLWDWSKRGKTWSMLGHLTQALSYWNERHPRSPIPKDWTIVELTAAGIREFPASEHYAQRRAKSKR